MKLLKSFLFVLFVTLAGCSKNDDAPTPTPQDPTVTNPSGTNVYIAGTTSNNQIATLWKNGVPTVFPVTAGASSQIVSLVVEGNDVYVLTNEFDPISFGSNIVLFKNNNKIDLGQGNARKLIVKNGNYYILGGKGYPNGFSDGFYFINGTKVTLFTNKPSDGVGDMYVKDNDVYVSGSKKFTPTGKTVAVLWTNVQTNETVLADDNVDSVAANIEFINNQINVLVYEKTVIASVSYFIKLWKNNLLNPLSNMPASIFSGVYLKTDAENNTHIIGGIDLQNGNFSYVYLKNENTLPIIASNLFPKECLDVVVKGSDVYIAGSQKFSNLNAPVVWKNGVATLLPNTSPDEVKSISVFNNDVYAVGKNNYSYWKNTEKQPQLPGENPKFSKIVVTN